MPALRVLVPVVILCASLSAQSCAGPAVSTFDVVGISSPDQLNRAGDVNGDGVGDYTVVDDNVVVMSPTGGHLMTVSPSVTAYTRASGVGDVNGDGFDDIAITAPWASHPVLGIGTTGFIEIRAGGLVGDPSLGQLLRRWDGTINGQRLGTSLTAIGDITGDGVSELVSGTAATDRVFVLDPTSGQVLFLHDSPPGTGVSYGATVAAIGDVNGDSVPDYAIGETTIDALHLVSGGGSVPLGTTLAVVFHSDFSSMYGVSSAGDLDGDGADEFIVTFDSGAIPTLVFSGLTYGLQWSYAGARRMVSAGGDYDGDGVPELIGLATLPGGTPTSIWFAADIVSGATGQFVCLMSGWPSQMNDVVSLGDVTGNGYPTLVGETTANGLDTVVLSGPISAMTPTYPGTGDDVALAVAVDGGGFQAFPGVQTASVGSLLTAEVTSPLGTAVGQPLVFALEPFATGSPPIALPYPGFHISLSASLIMSFGPLPLSVSSHGTSMSGVIPPFLAPGTSLMIQGAALPMGGNPGDPAAYWLTDGHEIQIQ